MPIWAAMERLAKLHRPRARQRHHTALRDVLGATRNGGTRMGRKRWMDNTERTESWKQRTDDDHEEHRGQEDVERLRAAECQKEDGIEGEQQGGSHDRRRETRQQSKGPGTGKGEQRG